MRAGRATFLIKVRSHRGEPINERADTLAEERREISDDDKRWDDRTDWMTFEVRKGNTTVRSVCTNSVRNAFRKQAGWAKLQEARAAAAIGHIQSAGCLGQKEVVTATHNACIRELLQEVDVHGKADRHMKLLTIETKRRLGTLWDQEQCTQFCSRDELWEAAKEEEMKIPWKAANEESPIPEEQYQERFWRRRLDGIGLDMVNKEFLDIEFKRTQDARSNYVERATAVAQEQYLFMLNHSTRI